jgi:hypothetical protein
MQRALRPGRQCHDGRREAELQSNLLDRDAVRRRRLLGLHRRIEARADVREDVPGRGSEHLDVTDPPPTPIRTLSSTGPASVGVPRASVTRATMSAAAPRASSQAYADSNAAVMASPPKASASPP